MQDVLHMDKATLVGQTIKTSLAAYIYSVGGPFEGPLLPLGFPKTIVK